MEGREMVKVYCGEEHINVPPQHVRDAQVEKAQAMLAEWAKKRQEKRKFVGREWCQPGEAIKRSPLIAGYATHEEEETL